MSETTTSATAQEAPVGGRVFFSNVRRSLEGEDEIILVSVGVDIGSSTSHLVFSRLVLERLDNRYIVSERTVLHESDVLLTPYAADQSIDAAALGAFIEAQYAQAGIAPEKIDTGALILTGVAVRRTNSRAIADLFAAQAGKFYSIIALSVLVALAIQYSPISPMKALFWSAVINGVVAVPLMVAIMILSSKRSVMGSHTASWSMKIFGWGATGFMGLAAMYLFIA